MARPRRASAARKQRSVFEWSEVAEAEAEHYELMRRVIDESRRDVTVDRLIHLGGVVRHLWRALDRGEDVADRVRMLFRAATGREDETNDWRNVIVAIAMVAKHSDAEIGRMLSPGHPTRAPTATAQQLCGLVCINLRGPTSRLDDAAKRLSEHHDKVAGAVRMWRRKAGRPSGARTRAPTGTKWAVIAEIIALAKLGKPNDKAVEKAWNQHGVEIT